MVPQGSVLGSLLFLIYINDIFDCINPTTFCHLYVDDTIIIQSAKYPTELCESLVYQLTPMSTWFFNNKFSVNTSKTEVIFFGKPDRVETCKNTEPVTFQGSTIDCTNKVKYLGIVFDEGMTWENQSNEARKNAYFNLIKIKKIVSFLDNRTKHLLLNALVCFPPH